MTEINKDSEYLHYLIGDATDPVQKPALICHCCNAQGKWGKGFVKALSARSPEPEKVYRTMENHSLGLVSFGEAHSF